MQVRAIKHECEFSQTSTSLFLGTSYKKKNEASWQLEISFSYSQDQIKKKKRYMVNRSRICWAANTVLVARTPPHPQPTYTSVESIPLLFPQHVAHLPNCWFVAVKEQEQTHILKS